MTKRQFAFGYALIMALAIVVIVGIAIENMRAVHWASGAVFGLAFGRLIWERA